MFKKGWFQLAVSRIDANYQNKVGVVYVPDVKFKSPILFNKNGKISNKKDEIYTAIRIYEVLQSYI